MKLFLSVLCAVLLWGCSDGGNPADHAAIHTHVKSDTKDRRKATVEYYNPRSGNRSTYHGMEVLVEDGKVTCVYFPRGGFIDATHFDPPEPEDGEAEIVTDKGIHYKITLD
ncbi:MAG: hypothetical protein QM610_15960 [Chitinophagaceae bacterium]